MKVQDEGFSVEAVVVLTVMSGWCICQTFCLFCCLWMRCLCSIEFGL